jgi:UrcA family protein
MTTLVNKVLLMAGLAGLSAGAGTAAVAADQGQALPSITLHYSNDALATDDGLKTFYHRLLRAAEKVCPPSPSDPYIVSDAVRECREQAVANAVTKINNSRLAAMVPHSTVKGT